MTLLKSSLVLAAMMLLITDLALATTYAVGPCKPALPSYSTISAAVAGAASGSTIEVCPGNYPEQVTITQPLTLTGITSGNSTAVVVTAPLSSLGSLTDDDGIDVAAHIVVTSAGPVNISFITVDGTGSTISDSNASEVGIFYGDSSGVVSNVTVRNLPFHFGYESGVLASANTAQSLTIESSNFHDIYNSSVLSEGVTLTAKANVMAAGGYNVQAFFGDNTVSGNDIVGTGCCWAINSSGSGTISGNTITNNNTGYFGFGQTVTNNKISNGFYGVYLVGDGGTIKGNLISMVTTGIEFGCSLPTTVAFNTINEATTALDRAPSSYAGSNKFNDVSTIRTGGCPNAQTGARPQAKIMAAPTPTP
ncbi:MAG TPA: hypothetical protein VKR59_09870 [Terriglobales bacterium]|nr:hypothetical protein [Terriglobales bacterium]